MLHWHSMIIILTLLLMGGAANLYIARKWLQHVRGARR